MRDFTVMKSKQRQIFAVTTVKGGCRASEHIQGQMFYIME